MSRHPYTPRRAGKRWQEGAPEHILDVFATKGKNDVTFYDVLLGGKFLDAALLAHRKVHALDCSHVKGSTLIQYTWNEWDAGYRPSHRRVRWLDVPQSVRDAIDTLTADLKD